MEKNILRVYKPEELKQMNLMFNKKSNNLIFTDEELKFANQFDLLDEHVGIVAKIIWKYRNNKKALEQLRKIFQDNEISDFNNVLGGTN